MKMYNFLNITYFNIYILTFEAYHILVQSLFQPKNKDYNYF